MISLEPAVYAGVELYYIYDILPYVLEYHC